MASVHSAGTFEKKRGIFYLLKRLCEERKKRGNWVLLKFAFKRGCPKMDGHLYIDICNAIKKELPDIHIHAFSPEEVLYGAVRSQIPVEEYLKTLKEAGVGSLPGTAAEILDQRMRNIISPGRITVEDWIKIIKLAHSMEIPTTSTIMYGHIESSVPQGKSSGIDKKDTKRDAWFY